MHHRIRAIALYVLVAEALACEQAPRTIEPGSGPVSGALAVTRDGRHILLADEDRDQLVVLDRVTRQITGTVALADAPAHVVELADGRAAVTTRYGSRLDIVDLENLTRTRTIAVGTEPFGLVEVADGLVAVVLAGDAAVVIVDIEAGAVTKTVALADPDPRAVALLADGSLYVSHMATGTFSRVRLDRDRGTRVGVASFNGPGPRIIPEHLRSLTLDPESGTVLVAHSQANSDTVRAPIDPNSGDGCGYSGCGPGPGEFGEGEGEGQGEDQVGAAEQLGAVVPAVTEVDPQTDTVLLPSAPGNRLASVFNPLEPRFIGTAISNPVALALFDGGRGLLIVNLSSKNALLLKRELTGTAVDVIGAVRLGNGAQAVALSRDGATAYVWNQFDRTISEIGLPRFDELDDGVTTDSKFALAPSEPFVSGPVRQLPSRVILLALADVLDVNASAGRKLFHDATDARISANGVIACASCHPDGRNDGRTWQFVFGPRNTPQLGGDILDTAPFHWPGDVPTVADLNSMTILPFMGGTGLDPRNFDSIAQFIRTIRAAPSVAAARGLNDAEARGEAVFYGEAAGCSTCHAGAHFTDNLAYDVGTAAGVADIAVFQTPVLHGLHRSAPFLHDGSQPSLEDLVNNVVMTGRMGNFGRTLTEGQARDLVAYLKTL